MDLQNNRLSDILWVDINQDQSCYIVGTEFGFRVYSIDPFKLTFSRTFEGAGGLGLVTMLYRSNILAMVGGGRNPRFQPHKVMLWDDRHPRPIAELSFRTTVRAVKLRRDLIVVVIESKVYLYRFSDLVLIDHLETVSNSKGLACLSSGQERAILACPGQQPGKVLVVTYDTRLSQEDTNITSPPACRLKTTLITAHEAPLAALGLSFDGSRLASASEKGTLVRVYDTASGQQLHELRRGVDRADIYSLCFNMTSEWLAVSSDKGTVHLFTLRQGSQNQKSSLSFLGGALPSYFLSEWSFAQFRVPDYRCICAFGQDPFTIVCLCADGSYYKARFDPVLGGEMQRVDYARFDGSANN